MTPLKRHHPIWLLLLLGVVTGWCPGAPIRVEGLPAEEVDLLIGTLRPRLEYIEKRAATAYRANDAAYLLERLLLRKGYSEVAVEPRLVNGGRIILLQVTPGPQYKMGPLEIQLPPNSGLEEKKIEAYFFQPLIERELVRREDAPYIEDYQLEGAANITGYLQSIGYWQASTEASQPRLKPAEGLVSFRLDVQPGTRYQMLEPRVQMPGPVPEALQRRLAPLKGRTASSNRLKQVRSEVRDYFQSEGFEFAEIAIDIRHEAGFSQVTAIVSPGRRHIIGEAHINGLERTQPNRLKRPFKQLRGQPYDRATLDRTVAELLQTGAFSSLLVEPIPTEAERLDFNVTATEAKARGYSVYAGAGSFEGGIFGAGYHDHNFLGKLLNFSTRAEISGRGLFGEIKLLEPFFAGENIGFTTRLFLQERTFEEYDKYEAGLEFIWDYDFSPQTRLELISELNFTNINAGSLPISLIGQEEYLAASVGVNLSYDNRDSAVTPTSGFYASGSAELFSIVGSESAIPFTKFELRSSYHHPLNEDLLLGVGARTGLISPLGDSDELPIDERFFIGGADTIRSFPWRDFGPRPSNPPLNQSVGGEAYWLVNLELEQKLAGPLWAVAFVDAGANSRDAAQVFSQEFDVAAGLGLRLKLPIGPVRLEYGHNLTQDAGEPNGAFHFAIGVGF